MKRTVLTPYRTGNPANCPRALRIPLDPALEGPVTEPRPYVEQLTFPLTVHEAEDLELFARHAPTLSAKA